MKNALIILLVLLNIHLAWETNKCFHKCKEMEKQEAEMDNEIHATGDYQIYTNLKGYSIYCDKRLIDTLNWNENRRIDSVLIADNL